MNRTLLEKVQYLLSNAGLAKSFWFEVLTYTSHLINRLSLSEIWRFGLGKMLKIMICSEYLDVQPITILKKINWILEQKRLCFWVSREV